MAARSLRDEPRDVDAGAQQSKILAYADVIGKIGRFDLDIAVFVGLGHAPGRRDDALAWKFDDAGPCHPFAHCGIADPVDGRFDRDFGASKTTCRTPTFCKRSPRTAAVAGFNLPWPMEPSATISQPARQ